MTGKREDAEHTFCSMGILGLAERGYLTDETTQATETLASVIREQFADRLPQNALNDAGMTIVRFNDHPDTTFADVERVFEKAEVAWDERI